MKNQRYYLIAGLLRVYMSRKKPTHGYYQVYEDKEIARQDMERANENVEKSWP